MMRRERNFAAVLAVTAMMAWPVLATCGERPNVLFLVIDDLNDWVGYLDGHPNAKTPNIDRLARRGTRFNNAHCAAPVCNASRTATLFGVPPAESGVYLNQDPWIDSDRLETAVPLPQLFRQQGYHTMGIGKLFHQESESFSEANWDADGGRHTAYGYELKVDGFVGFPEARCRHPWDLYWGALDEERSEQLADGQIATWAVEQLQKTHQKPFFLSVGFFRPHTPLTAPQRFFDMFDPANVALPPANEDDLDDMPWMGRQVALAGYQAMEGSTDQQIEKRGYRRELIQSYLACTSYVDSNVGRVLDALRESPYADNTIVVLWSDHGWGLGERYHWKKWGLWDDITHVPLVIYAPGVTDPDALCETPVSLIDLYPTLVDLCGLSQPTQKLLGRSLRPLLRDPETDWERPATTTLGPNNHALRSRRWRYIRWADGSEELYDHTNDPNEWRNVAERPENEVVKRDLRRWLPEVNVKALASDPGTNVIRLTPENPRQLFHAVQPTVAGHAITISAEINPSAGDGVIVSHAGMFAGYSLYVKEGHLCMAVMDVPKPLNWNTLEPKRTIVKSDQPLPRDWSNVEGRLGTDGAMTLRVNGQLVASGLAGGPLSIHPAGEMQLGQHPVVGKRKIGYPPAGDFIEPFKFQGQIREAVIRFSKDRDENN